MGQVEPAFADADLADQMLEQVNQVRMDRGLAPLVQEQRLASLAGERSWDMAARHYFSHITPEGRTIFTLMSQRGIDFRVAGENLAWNNGGEQSASAIAVDGFLNSAAHRANLLNADFSQLGIGVASADGRIYFTLVFLG